MKKKGYVLCSIQSEYNRKKKDLCLPMNKEQRFIFLGILLVVFFLSVSSITFPIFVAQTIKSQNVICIDAGHGGSDPGKVGKNNVLEKDINLSIALKLQKLLEKQNYKVYMTRTGDYNLADSDQNKKRTDLSNRKKQIYANDPLAVISIHQNSYPSSDVHGAQVFYPQNSQKSKLLADSIQTAFIKDLDSKNKRVAKANSDYYLFRDNPYPIVIVECGFLSNPRELKLLQDTKYQQKAVKCIYIGLKTCQKELGN